MEFTSTAARAPAAVASTPPAHITTRNSTAPGKGHSTHIRKLDRLLGAESLRLHLCPQRLLLLLRLRCAGQSRVALSLHRTQLHRHTSSQASAHSGATTSDVILASDSALALEEGAALALEAETARIRGTAGKVNDGTIVERLFLSAGRVTEVLPNHQARGGAIGQCSPWRRRHRSRRTHKLRWNHRSAR